MEPKIGDNVKILTGDFKDRIGVISAIHRIDGFNELRYTVEFNNDEPSIFTYRSNFIIVGKE